MKNKRIVASLVAALSSFASSMAAGNGGNVKIMSKGEQANITNKLNGNKIGALSNGRGGKPIGSSNLLGKKRRRSGGSASSSGAGRNSKGKNSVNGKHGKKSDKNSSFSSTSKNFDGVAPVSLKSNLEKTSNSKNTIIPHVPNGVTYGVGGTVAGLGTAAIGATVSSKVFKRSIIDKIKYGITLQGVVDYFKKNTKFVTKNVDGQKVALLELDLKNGKKMFVHAYAEFGMLNSGCWGSNYKLIFSDNLENVQADDLKLPKDGISQKPVYDGIDNYSGIKDADGNVVSYVTDYALGLRDLVCCGNGFTTGLKGSVFERAGFSRDDADYVYDKINPHIQKLVDNLKSNNQDLQVVKFKNQNNPTN